MKNKLVIIVASFALSCGTKGHDSDHEHRDEHEAHGEAGSPNLVKISESGQKRSGIEIGTVTAEPMVGGVRVPAEVQLNPDRVAHITPMFAGQVTTVNASLGDAVDRNQTLVTLRSVALGEARADLSRAQGAVDLAQANFDRQKELRDEGIGAKRNLLEAENELRRTKAELAAARDRLRVYGGSPKGASVAIRSPLKGVVIERHATPGEVVGTERPMFVVADTSSVWVVGRVYAQDIAVARVGAAAAVSLQSYPDRTWQGTVSYVASTLDPHTRTLPIRVELDNPDAVLRPGLFGTISLAPMSDSPAVPVVPEGAVQQIRGEASVFVPTTTSGEFRAVVVTVGVRANGRVAITSGVAPGDRVVVKGAFTLKSELLRGELGDGDDH